VIADEYIPAYADQGFRPVIIHTGTDVGYGLNLSGDTAGVFPVLLDTDNTILDVFQQLGPEAILFPLAFLVDRNGVIRHVYNEKELPGEVSPHTLIEDVEALLAE